MRRIEHTHDGCQNLKSVSRTDSTALFHLRVERAAFDILHHHVDGAIRGRAQIVNSNCIRMSKPARSLAFTTKATEPFRVCPDFRGQNLDRYTITKQDVSGAINSAHPTLA